MKRRQAYKFQIMPNGEQMRLMRKFAGSCRFVYNVALKLQKENHEAGKPFIGYVVMAAKLPILKICLKTKWLKESPSQSLQPVLKDLDRAFKNFFERRASFPRFKKKGKGDSFCYPDPKQFKVDSSNSKISLPKLG
ncbi:transposase [Gammaproteobacteria bacterium]